MRPLDPTYHWVDDLNGYYDGDEECEEHNVNDDMTNFSERDWDWQIVWLRLEGIGILCSRASGEDEFRSQCIDYVEPPSDKCIIL